MTVAALRGHRPEVLDDLLARYGRELAGVARLTLRDQAGAEDVVVDTLLMALDRGEQLRDEAALRPAPACRRCWQEGRRRLRRALYCRSGVGL
jgi:DNA-directed RNA polymerase specialized sigma24 family protein